MSQGLTVTPTQVDALSKLVARMRVSAENGRPQPTFADFAKELNLTPDQEANVAKLLEKPQAKKHLTSHQKAVVLKKVSEMPCIAASSAKSLTLPKITKQNLTVEQEERIFELLEETFLADRSNKIPPLCGYAIGFAVHIPPRSGPFRVKYPSLLDAILRFIATSRNSSEMLELGDEMAVCRCDLRDPVVDFLRAPASEGCGGCECESCATKIRTWSHCLFKLMQTIIRSIENAKLADVAMVREKKKKKTGKWPASASVLLPTGRNR
ncbi:hypothetical protein C8J56DRAFT_1084779 [Mycena floridula]|nr:hypothetical protein C8J56DRAFT_1084779 [Mycena floridula]